MYDKHKIFLYQLLKNGVLPVTRALQFCRNIKADDVRDVVTLKEFTSIINREITKQEFKIVLNVCEVTGQQQVILINTANDDISKLQNAFSTLQLEFFQKILQETVTSKEKKLPHIYCLNLSTKLTGKLTHADAEKLIDKWTRMGYLVQHDNDIYLGSRCIMEFTSFFKGYCKDYIQNCSLCSELVFKGSHCISCMKVMHVHCLEKFLKKHNCCPECKQQWQNGEPNSSITNDETSVSSDEENVAGPSQRKRVCKS